MINYLKSGVYITLLATSALASPALAQNREETSQTQSVGEGEDSDTIVVTARKQSESLLKTPASITVLTAESLESKNITRANELTGIVPGLVQTNGNGSLPATTFRGLGTNSSVPSAEPSVAYFVDGIYFSHLRDYTSPIYDVRQVELIKGTQSTLLGKNTSVGAISIVTNKPTNEFEGTLRYTRSFETRGDRIEGVINVPFGENVQVRAAFLANNEEGMVYNLFRKQNEPRVRDISGKIAIAWQPGEGINILLRYQHDERDQKGFQWELLKDPSGIVSAWAATYGQVINTKPDRISNSGSAALGGTIAGPEEFEKQNTNRLNLLAEIALGDHTLTMQTGYHEWRNPRYTDIDQIAANIFGLQENEYTKSFTQEIRINSPSGNRFTYLAGAFYYWNDWGNNPITGGSPSNTVGFPVSGIANTQLFQNTKAISVFSSGSYKISDQLTIDAGARFTNEKKSGSMSRQSSGVIAAVSLPTLPLTQLPELKKDSLDYSVGLRYEPTSQLLFYATFSKGSKSGGYQDGAALPSLAPYAPEKALSAEIGAKLTLDGGFLALALFNTEVKDFQNNYTATVSGLSRSLIGNADIRSRGFEMSGQMRLAPGFRIGGSLVYADGEYLEDFPANGSVALKGQPLTRNPKWSGQVEMSYDRNVAKDLDLFGSLTFDFASKAILQSLVTQPNAPFMKEHQTLNAKLGLRYSDNFEVSVIGTNLTDTDYVTFATAISASGGAYAGSLNRGRVIALQVGYKF